MQRKSIIVLIFAIVFWTTLYSNVSAVATKSVKATPTPTATLTPTPTPNIPSKVDYVLPYPGVLPDHPLYFLKVWRDKIMNFLIQDPLKKVEFDILMADKRIAMGMMLTDKGKTEQAVKIVVEAEEFMDKALSEAKRATDQGRVIRDDIVKKLEQSLSKHKEVITELLTKSPENIKEGYQKVLDSITTNQEKLPTIGK